jgi:hypothetical protein
MAESIIGKPISKEVSEQIKKREEKVSSPSRDNDVLFFLNSNNAWIKLSSGANTLTAEEIATVEKAQSAVGIEGDSSLAKNNLLGPNQNRGGIGTDNSLYRVTNSRGYRPAPGITKVNVKSKGTYGTLRETDVSFVVWSVEDLDTMETLYLRPGFSMLLEWGHTSYFTTSGEFRTATSTIADFFSSYTSQDGTSAQKLVQDAIDKLRVESNYNYDGLFGYVKNFSWSLRKDGGYDCTISIASVGSLIEGLRADVGLQNIPNEYVNREDVDSNPDFLKSPFHYIFDQIKKADFQLNTGGAGTRRSISFLKSQTSSPETAYFFSRLKIFPFTYVYGRQVTSFSTFLGNMWAKEVYWMHLSMVFDIINTYMTLKTKSGETVQIYSGAQDVLAAASDDYSVESKFCTTPYHFSIDPFRVLLPDPPTIPSTFDGIGMSEDVKKYLGRIPSTSDVYVNALGGRGFFSEIFGSPRGKKDDILNIIVSSNLLTEIFDRNVDDPESQNRDMKTILDNLASALTDNLGGINEFAFHYDEPRNLFILVDRKNTPTEGTVEYPTFTLTGLKSTMTNVSLSSKLSNRVATQIAVAAQGSGDNYQDNVSEILEWNKGVIDRHGVGGTFNTDSATAAAANSDEYYRRVKWLTTAANTFKNNGSSDQYDASKYSELKPLHRIYTSHYVLDELVAQGQAPKGIIPVELSFTMLGISGIDIAESFRIASGILPARYSDSFGFIITGLEHEIADVWRTTIRTQFYMLQKPSESLIEGKKSFLGTRPQGAVKIAGLGGSSGFGAGGTSQSGGGGTSQSGGGQLPSSGFAGETPNADLLRKAISENGHYEKAGKQISNAGDIEIGIAKFGIALIKKLKSIAPNLILKWSAGNDLYHKNLQSPSRHKSGQALDFALVNPTVANLKIVDSTLDLFLLMNDPYARYINEYSFDTPNSTGGHYHMSWPPDGRSVDGSAALARVRKNKTLQASKNLVARDYIVTV